MLQVPAQSPSPSSSEEQPISPLDPSLGVFDPSRPTQPSITNASDVPRPVRQSFVSGMDRASAWIHDRNRGSTGGASVNRNPSNSSFFNHIHLDGSARSQGYTLMVDGAECDQWCPDRNSEGGEEAVVRGTRPLKLKKRIERVAPIGPPRMRRRQSNLSLPRSPLSPRSPHHLHPFASRSPTYPISPVSATNISSLNRGASTASSAHRAISKHFLALNLPSIVSTHLPTPPSAVPTGGVSAATSELQQAKEAGRDGQVDRAGGGGGVVPVSGHIPRSASGESNLHLGLDTAGRGLYDDALIRCPSPPATPLASPPYPSTTGSSPLTPATTSGSISVNTDSEIISPRLPSEHKPLPPSPITPLTPSRAPSKAAQILGTRPAPPPRAVPGGNNMGAKLSQGVAAGVGVGKAIMAGMAAAAGGSKRDKFRQTIERSGDSKNKGNDGDKKKPEQYRPLGHSTVFEVQRFFGDIPKPSKPPASQPSSRFKERSGDNSISRALTRNRDLTQAVNQVGCVRAGQGHAEDDSDGRFWLDADEEQEFAWLLSSADVAPNKRGPYDYLTARLTEVRKVRQKLEKGNSGDHGSVGTQVTGDLRDKKSCESLVEISNRPQGGRLKGVRRIEESFLDFDHDNRQTSKSQSPMPSTRSSRPLYTTSSSASLPTHLIPSISTLPVFPLSRTPSPPVMSRTLSPPSRPKHRPPPLDLTALPRIRNLPIAIITSPSPSSQGVQPTRTLVNSRQSGETDRAVPHGVPSSSIELFASRPGGKDLTRGDLLYRPNRHPSRPSISRREVSDHLPLSSSAAAGHGLGTVQPRTPFNHPRVAPQVPTAPPLPDVAFRMAEFTCQPNVQPKATPLPQPAHLNRSLSPSIVLASHLVRSVQAGPGDALDDLPFIAYSTSLAIPAMKPALREYRAVQPVTGFSPEEELTSYFEPMTPVLAASGYNSSHTFGSGGVMGGGRWLKKAVGR